MLVEESQDNGWPKGYYKNSNATVSSYDESALFQDEEVHHVVDESSMSLFDHNLTTPQSSSLHQFNASHDNDGKSLSSFQMAQNDQDYDRLSYARKSKIRSKFSSQLRTSSPDRGGGGVDTIYEDDDYYAYGNGRNMIVDSNGDTWQSRSRRVVRSDDSSTIISYIDYNDSHYDNNHRHRKSSSRRHSMMERSRSRSPSISGSGSGSGPGDRRVGSTIRTDIGTSSAATSAVTFDDSDGYTRSQSSYRREGHRRNNRKLVEYNKSHSDEERSIMSKPNFISVPSPDKLAQRKSIEMRNRSGRQQIKPPFSSKMHVHEMGSRRNVSKRRSTSNSRTSSRDINRTGTRTRSRSLSKRIQSSGDRNEESRRKRSSSTKSRRSRDSNGSESSSSRRENRSRSRHLDSNGDIELRSINGGAGDEERRKRDRRRDMMTGRATKHLLDDDKSTYSRSSVRHDIDDDGYCMHHPEIKLMRLRSDGYWSVVRKKCPKCIYEDCPTLLSDIDIDEEDWSQGSEPTSPRMDDSDAVREILNSSRMFSFHNIMSPEDIEKEEELNRLKRRLAARAYHFPGNSWCEDWMQFLSNTHTVLGIFFHHPLHPLKIQERMVILFGSIAIGLTISNMTYLYFTYNDYDEVLFSINARHSKWTGIPEIVVTKVMITLWTLGSFLHTVFDLSLWHMKACTLCRYCGLVDEKLARWGRLVGLFIVMIVIVVGSYAVLLRATLEYKGEGSVSEEVEETLKNNEIYELGVEDKRSFRFLLGYLVEFVLALFVYYPIAVTVLFSGVLGCNGSVPLLGGRPREVKKELLHLQKKNEATILRTKKSEGSENVAANNASASSSFDRADSFDYFDEDQVI